MKKVICFYSKFVILIVLLLCLLSKLSLFMNVFGKTAEQDPDRMNALFYYLPKDSVDLLFMGDSHSYCTYIPKDIFDETGISGASLATSSNSVINQYWQLKEAIKKQKIKYVVMETHPFELIGDNNSGDVYLHFTSGISTIPDYSINKYKNYLDIKKHPYGISDSISLSDVYNLTRYTQDLDRNLDTSLEEIKQLLFNPSVLYKTFGYFPTSKVINLGNIETYCNDKEKIEFKQTIEYEYLEKIYKLCKDNDAILLLSRSIFNDSRDYHFANIQIDEWAKENNIDVIDYFKLIEECGFDINKDFRDTEHFNYYGAKKATSYFINYFVNNYEYVDHRGDSKYQLWENNDFDYNNIKEN